MKRIITEARQHWKQTVEAQKFVFHSLGGPYWHEKVGYQFSSEEAKEIENASNELHRLSLAAVEYVISQNLFSRFHIGDFARELVTDSWRKKERGVYGRFDLSYDGIHPPKLLEYNADTPTSLLEAARIQRGWQKVLFPDYTQFNLIEECLALAWSRLELENSLVHFSSVFGSTEDQCNVEYMRSIAAKAGLATHFLFVEELLWDEERRGFYDPFGNEIKVWFKLYPWEWLVSDKYAEKLSLKTVRLIEPAWKMLLSNKAILPILWELFPGHPNLLPSYTSPEKIGANYVRKPIWGREGSNVSIHFPDKTAYIPGPYGKDPVIYQEFCPLMQFGNVHALVGSWIIGDKAAGIGIREGVGLISQNRSRFAPHIVH